MALPPHRQPPPTKKGLSGNALLGIGVAVCAVVIVVAVVSLLVGTWVIRESRDQAEGRRFDPPGIALLTGTLFTLLWGLIDAEKHGWGHFQPFAWLITSALLLVLFVAWEVREERIRSALESRQT